MTAHAPPPPTERDEPVVQFGVTQSGRLARNSVWNFAGHLVPALIGLFAVPALVQGLGIERFGLLSLVWMLIGYFSILDLGLGAALTRTVSTALVTRPRQDLGTLIWTAVAAMLLFGIAGAVVLLGFQDLLVTRVLHVSPRLHGEALAAVRILAAALPIVTGTSALIGVLAAYQRFAAINAVRIPLGILNVVGPLALLPWRHDLGAVTAILVAQRGAAALAYFAFVRGSDPELARPARLRPAVLAPLIAFGRWITLSGVIGPFMVYMDRFVITGVMSTAVIAYYTAPFDLLARMWILSAAITGVLFPALAASLAVDRPRARALFEHGLALLHAALLPIALGACLFAREGLRLWLGPEFAANGTLVVQWLSGAMFVNALAQIALAVVQSSGRPRIGALLHLIELPLYAVAIWTLLHRVGLVGAAIAWAARAAVDALVLFVVAGRLVGVPRAFRTRAAIVMALTIGAFALAAAPLAVRVGAYLISLLAIAVVVVRSGLVMRVLTALRKSPHTDTVAR